MDSNEVPEVFWEVLRGLNFEAAEVGSEALEWRPPLPDGLTDVLEVAESSVSFGRMVHLVGDPASTGVAYSHVVLQHGLLGMRVYFPARFVPGSVGIPAYVVGFRDLPQVRRMYEVQRVLESIVEVTDVRSAYGQAVSSATVSQAMRALAGLASYERLPFTLVPIHAA